MDKQSLLNNTKMDISLTFYVNNVYFKFGANAVDYF